MHFALLLAIEKIESAGTLEALATAIEEAAPSLSFDDLAASIPLAFCDQRDMPEDPAGAVAWDADNVLRFDFEKQTFALCTRTEERSAVG